MAHAGTQLASEARPPNLVRESGTCGAMEAAIAERLLDRYREQVEQAGYVRAIADVQATLVWIAEQYLNEHPDSGDRRRDVYAIVAHFEQAIRRLPRNDFVEGGLGI